MRETIAAVVELHIQADELLVASTLPDLTIGSSSITATVGGETLTGVPQPWKLYAVASCEPP